MNETNSLTRPPSRDAAARAALVKPSDRMRWFDSIAGERLSIRVSGGEVGGHYAILESIAQPGTAAPLHTHLEDEIFQILDGVMTFRCGGEQFEAAAGTTVVVPAGAEHAWKNRTAKPVRMLVMFTPGGVETLFQRIGGRAPDEIAALAPKYGTFVVGPPIAD